MTRRELSLLALGALALSAGTFGACSREPAPVRSPRGSLLDPAGGRAAYASPATWRYHPRSEAPLNARAELSDGTVLFAGNRGERWLYQKKTGAVRAAARLAPEALIAILRTESGWLYVGASGTSYESREPLGAFTRASPPLDRLAKVAAAGSSIVGVTREGQLVHSGDAGATWKVAGPIEARFVDVVVGDAKRGLALSVPEALWESRDDGATWRKLEQRTSGALALGHDEHAGITVQTALGWMRWDPAAPAQLSALGRTPQAGRFKLPARPERGPDAVALGSGRAIVLGDEYLEVARDEKGRGWTLHRGPIGGRLVARAVDVVASCNTLRLAGFDRWLYLGCSKVGSGVNQPISFYRSDDGGKHFELEPYTAEGRIGDLALAVGAEGSLLVTGICAAHTKARGCSPYGVHTRRKAVLDAGAEGGAHSDGGHAKKKDASTDGDAAGEEWELTPSVTPALKGPAQALVFSPDGRTAFALGKRTKGTSLAVFVSRDGGKSFEAREVEQVQAGQDEPDPIEDRWARPPPTPATTISSVGPADDGSLAIVMRSSGAPTLIVVDEAGRVISLSRGPGEANTIAATGTRALAFSSATRQAWESLDGGVTWDPIGRLPAPATCAEGSDCDQKVVCHPGGCVIGSELSRVGWHGQADDDQGLLAPGESTVGDLYDRKVRTPIACNLDEPSWHALEGVSIAPTAKQAAIGKLAWYALAQDDRQASATVHHATGGNRPKVEAVALLPAVKNAASHAYAAIYQVEGAAAVRYTVSDVGTPGLKNVEVVWDNILEGKVGRARVPDLGLPSVSDYVRIGAGAQRAQPDLLSITPGGIYLRIHYAQKDAQPTLFLDGRTTTSIPAVSWPTSMVTGAHTEVVRAQGTHVPVLVLPGGAAVVRARRDGSGWSFDALATGLADPARFGLMMTSDLAYAGGRPGHQLLIYDADGTRKSHVLYPIRPDGAVADAPIALPTQVDTGDKPARCGSVHKSDTPRVVVPYQGGTRHPVLVSDVTEPVRVLLTGHAVMHGSPEEPCVAALDAEVVPIDPSTGAPEQERAILPLDDLEHSWIFRIAFTPMGEPRVEYRLMSCRFDPTLEVPQEVYALAGTKVRRTR